MSPAQPCDLEQQRSEALKSEVARVIQSGLPPNSGNCFPADRKDWWPPLTMPTAGPLLAVEPHSASMELSHWSHVAPYAMRPLYTPFPCSRPYSARQRWLLGVFTGHAPPLRVGRSTWGLSLLRLRALGQEGNAAFVLG